MERFRRQRRKVVRHCSNTCKNGNRSESISNQILYGSCQTSRFDGVLDHHTTSSLSHQMPSYPLITRTMQIDILEEKLLGTHLFPLLFLTLQSQNRLFGLPSPQALQSLVPIPGSTFKCLNRYQTWSLDIEAKRTQMMIKPRNLHWQINQRLKLSLEYKGIL